MFDSCPHIDSRPYRYSVVVYKNKRPFVLACFVYFDDALSYARSRSTDFPGRVLQVLTCLF